MNFITKKPHGNGHIYVYLLGIKIASYRPTVFMGGVETLLKHQKTLI